MTLNSPDELATTLGIEAPALPRATLEALAVEGYPERKLFAKQVQLLIGNESRREPGDFLTALEVWPCLTLNGVLEDLRTAGAAKLPTA